MQINIQIPNNQKAQKPQDIHERIYNFVIDVLGFIKKLKPTPENLVIIHQIAKSVTSMGANDQEADGTESRRDFIAKYSIVKKESKKTSYWLRIISDTNPDLSLKGQELLREGNEIIRIVSSIIINTKKNI